MAMTTEDLLKGGVQDPSTFSAKIKKGLNTFLGKEATFDVTLIDNAADSFLKTRYGIAENNDIRLNVFIEKISRELKHKIENRMYAMVYAIPEDIIEYKETILNFFKMKGYVTSEINGSKDEFTGLQGTYIFLGYDNFRFCEEKSKNSAEKKEN